MKKTMVNGNGNSISDRLVRVEEETRSIKEDVSQLRKDFGSFVEESQVWRERQSRPNWSLLVSIAGIAATFFGVAGSLMIGLVSISWVVMNAEMSRIQSQLHASDEVRNVQHAVSSRNDAITWNALHELGAKFPQAPSGPFYEPHTGQDH